MNKPAQILFPERTLSEWYRVEMMNIHNGYSYDFGCYATLQDAQAAYAWYCEHGDSNGYPVKREHFQGIVHYNDQWNTLGTYGPAGHNGAFEIYPVRRSIP